MSEDKPHSIILTAVEIKAHTNSKGDQVWDFVDAQGMTYRTKRKDTAIKITQNVPTEVLVFPARPGSTWATIFGVVDKKHSAPASPQVSAPAAPAASAPAYPPAVTREIRQELASVLERIAAELRR